MLHIPEGETIQVQPAETFVIERRSVAGGGAQSKVEVPDGVLHVGSLNPDPLEMFGGRPKIQEKFRCLRAGKFEIRFVSGRQWEKDVRTVITTVICR